MVDGMLTSLNDGVRKIVFNQPRRKNAISGVMYREITRILNEDATDDKVVITIFTGTGEYFTSGNDISSGLSSGDMEEEMRKAWRSFKEFAEALINYPKLLIVVVNGPAIGIGSTLCALCDVVYASDRSSFQTPFVKLGLCCEAGSSYMFPRILGRSKASEVLLLGHQMSAEEAYRYNFISKIVKHQDLEQFITDLQRHGKLSLNALILNKRLMKSAFDETLLKTHERECEQLWECQNSEEFFTNIMAFMNRKSNKSKL